MMVNRGPAENGTVELTRRHDGSYSANVVSVQTALTDDLCRHVAHAATCQPVRLPFPLAG